MQVYETLYEYALLMIAIFAIVQLWVRGWDVDHLPVALMIGGYDGFCQALKSSGCRVIMCVCGRL